MPPGPDGAPSVASPEALRRRDPAAKRAKIVDAASALFEEEGFEATSTAAIARRAGVSEGIVFHHFGSKHGLLQAVAEGYGRSLARAMFEAEPGVEATIESVLRRAFAFVREHGALAMMLVVAASPEALHLARKTLRDEILDVLEGSFDAGIAEGRIRPLPSPRITAGLLFALVDAALIGCFIEGDGSREEEYLREAVACIEGALRREALLPTRPRSPS